MRHPTLSELPPPPPGKTGWPFDVAQDKPWRANGLTWPQVSIVTPSYNQAQFLEETILSVLNQDYPNIEYIIIDGGSTDGSVDILRKYEDRLAYWVSEPDRGQSHAVNKGWRRVKGEIIGWLNSDDMYCPGAISRVVEAYLDNPNTVVFYGDCNAISLIGEHLSKGTMQDYTISKMLCGKYPPQPAVFIHRTVLDEVGFLDEELHYSMDGDYFLRVWHRYPETRLCYVRHALANFRMYRGNKTSQGDKVAAALHGILDRFFSRDDLDDETLALRRRAYANVYWRRARFELENSMRLAAMGDIFRFISLSPTMSHPRTVMRFLALALLPRAVVKRVPRLRKYVDRSQPVQPKLAKESHKCNS